MTVPEDVDLNELREVTIKEWMNFDQYEEKLMKRRLDFMSIPLLKVSQDKILQGWLKGHDPAKVYGKEVDKYLKASVKAQRNSS